MRPELADRLAAMLDAVLEQLTNGKINSPTQPLLTDNTFQAPNAAT